MACSQALSQDQQDMDDHSQMRHGHGESQLHDGDRESQLHDGERGSQQKNATTTIAEEISFDTTFSIGSPPAQPPQTLVEGSNDETKDDVETKETVLADVKDLRIVAQGWVVVLQHAARWGEESAMPDDDSDDDTSVFTWTKKFVVDCTNLLSNMKDLDLDEAKLCLSDLRDTFDFLRQMMLPFLTTSECLSCRRR